jgi:cobalamin biosynthesis Mg chelatase CobN
MAHPQRNIISRDLGSAHWEEDTKEVEVDTFPLQPSSILLLCSDGLCDMITSVQMKEILAENISLEEKVQALIDSANVAGGKDNVTVVLVQTEFPYESSPVKVELEVNEKPESSVSKPSQTSAKKGEGKKTSTPKKSSKSASPSGKGTGATTLPVAKKSSAFTLTTLISILITAIVALGIGYYLGGSTGSKTFPKVFPPVKVVDSDKVDSIVEARTKQLNDSIKMQNDTIIKIQKRIDAVKELVSQSEQ